MAHHSVSSSLPSSDTSARPIQRFALALADFVMRRRWLVLVSAAVLAMAAGAGLRNAEFANNYRVFFGKENPELLAFEELQATYSKTDNILFVLQPRDGGVFRPELAAGIEALTEAAWHIPYTTRVDSITNFQHTWADGDDLTVEDLVEDGATQSPEELARRQAIALAEPLLRGNLVSPDAATTGINVTLNYPEESITEVPEAAGKAREIAASMREQYPDLTVAITGVSMLNNAFAESARQDMSTLVPAMYGILLLVMVFTLRSAGATFATLIVILFSTAVAVGLASWVGHKLNPISATAPTIVLTLAIADSIHVLVSVRKLMQRGVAKAAAIREAVRINFVPVSVTSLTTIVGFLALNFSDAPPFRHLGNLTAVGIGAAWLFSLTLLPALVHLLPIRMKARRRASSAARKPALLERYSDFIVRRYRAVFAIAAVTAVTVAAFLPRIELNDEWVGYFDKRVDFRNDAEFAMDHLNGLYQVEYSVKSGRPGGINDPAYLGELDRFTRWLRAQNEVTHVYSYADIIRRLNKNMNGDDDAKYAIPKEPELAAQYLLVYELSLPYGLDLNDRIDIDKSATRITATLPEISTRETRDFLERSEQWFADNIAPPVTVEASGPTVMFAHISERNINSMLRGNVLAILLIAVVVAISLRSAGIGLLSLIPNTLPIAVTFGLWVLLVGKVGMAAATVTATSLGIVVDDTVHFLAKYLLARREKNASPADAVRYAFDTVGPALVATSAILAVGFVVLTYSTFRINFEMGLLTAITILVALVLDFTLLPALLLLGDRKRKRLSASDANTPAIAATVTAS